jgi:hypothetical protein
MTPIKIIIHNATALGLLYSEIGVMQKDVYAVVNGLCFGEPLRFTTTSTSVVSQALRDLRPKEEDP